MKKYINTSFCKFILGSDQVIRHPWHNNFIYFLDWIQGDKTLIAYAPSFGKSRLDMNSRELSYAKKCLERFDAFSVRESAGANILQTYFGMDVPVVCDPTLLLKPADYQSIIDQTSEINTTEDYIAFYLLSYSESITKILSGKYRLINAFYDENGKYRTVGDWLKIIQNAKYVITDSYHGVIFSLIFHRQFFILNSSNNDCRFAQLSKLIGIDRYITFDDLQNDIEEKNNIDYGKFDVIINSCKNFSLIFLKNSLSLPGTKKNDLSSLFKETFMW